MGKQNFIGVVVAHGKMVKTVRVRVQLKSFNRKIQKELINKKDYLVHDEGNITHTGDIVRIESIPKISPRKYFAIAEIKKKGQKVFSFYDKLSEEKVSLEEIAEKNLQNEKKKNFDKLVLRLDMLKRIDFYMNKLKTLSGEEADEIKKKIELIKNNDVMSDTFLSKKLLNSDLKTESEIVKLISITEERRLNIDFILSKLMSDENSEIRNKILKKVSKKDPETLKQNIQKNILRKYILNARNDCPIDYSIV